MKRRTVKIAVDIAMAAVLVAVMTTAIVQEAPHEYLGAALFALIVAHIVLNRRWLASVLRGRYTIVRTLQVASIAGVAGSFLGLVVSSLVISKHAFGWLPALPGANWARRVHMLCSYWLFVLAFVHAGLHIHVPRSVPEAKLRVARLVLAAASCYGVYSFVRLGMLPYLLGRVQFAAADYEAPLVLGFARYASIGVLIACLTHCLRAALQRRTKSSGSEAS